MLALDWRHHRRRIFIQQRRAAAYRPVVRGADPFAGGVAKRFAQFRMFDIGHAFALEPVRIDGILVRLA